MPGRRFFHRRTSTAFTATSLLALSAIVTTVRFAAAEETTPPTLVGTWKLAAQKVDKKAEPFTLTFLESGGIEFLSDTVSMTGTYEVDDGPTPRHVSLHYRNEPAPWHGIYQFRDGQLWLCFGDAGVPPPKKFEGGKGQALYKFTPAK
ncbi:MAG: hypothetical protein QM775_17680 [Pirellulales bacterium]